MSETPTNFIPYGRQDITAEDLASVARVLQSDWLTQGPAVPRFEERFASYCGVAHAVAVNSATSALHIACMALGLGAGDVLWTSPNTFVASANCALYCGAGVDFVDIDRATHNMSVAALAQKLSQARRENRLPKIVVPVHFAGQSCDMKAIHALGQEYGFRIIEDASHAVGGFYGGARVGSCRYSDVTIFSFHPVKIITTTEGGLALTNDASLAERMVLLRSHGITRDAARMTVESEGPWYYEQRDLGFNYRMTDVQAALGLSQMERLDAYVARRQELARNYDRLLTDMPVTPPWRTADLSALHLYVVRLNLHELKVTRRQAFDAMRAAGIGVNVHYIPVYRQPFYQAIGYDRAAYPECEQYYAEALTLPLYPALTDSQQSDVVSALRQALQV